jgi:hypothetical protein
MKKVAALLFVIPFAVDAPLPAAAPLSPGVVFEIETTDHRRTPAEVSRNTMSVEGVLIRMNIAEGASARKGAVIFRGDRREMIALDHSEKTFTVIDAATLESLAGQLNAAAAQMEEMLKTVPEAQREEIRKMMKDRMPATKSATARPELRSTGERGTHAGYATRRYDIMRGGRRTQELWVTDWNSIEGGAELKPALESLAGFLKSMTDSLAGGPLGSVAEIGGSGYELVAELGAFPIVARTMDESGKVVEESKLLSSARRDLDPADFEPPKDYKRRTIAGR